VSLKKLFGFLSQKSFLIFFLFHFNTKSSSFKKKKKKQKRKMIRSQRKRKKPSYYNPSIYEKDKSIYEKDKSFSSQDEESSSPPLKRRRSLSSRRSQLFTRELSSIEGPPSILIFMPKELWTFHVCLFLCKKDLKSVRLSNRWFRKEVTAAIWKQWVPFEQLNVYQSGISKLHWEEYSRVYGIYFWRPETPLTLQDIPPTLQILDISTWRNTRSIVDKIPESLKLLILPWIGYYDFTEQRLIDLLIHYPHLNIEVEGNRSILYLACSLGYFELIKFLITNRKLVSLINGSNGDFNQTPLFIACDKGHEGIVEYLLEHGANVSLTTKFGYSPLMVACYKGWSSLVTLLLENGADILKQDNNGKDAFYWTEQKNIPFVCQLIKAILNSKLSSQTPSKTM